MTTELICKVAIQKHKPRFGPGEALIEFLFPHEWTNEFDQGNLPMVWVYQTELRLYVSKVEVPGYWVHKVFKPTQSARAQVNHNSRLPKENTKVIGRHLVRMKPTSYLTVFEVDYYDDTLVESTPRGPRGGATPIEQARLRSRRNRMGSSQASL